MAEYRALYDAAERLWLELWFLHKHARHYRNNEPDPGESERGEFLDRALLTSKEALDSTREVLDERITPGIEALPQPDPTNPVRFLSWGPGHGSIEPEPARGGHAGNAGQGFTGGFPGGFTTSPPGNAGDGVRTGTNVKTKGGDGG